MNQRFYTLNFFGLVRELPFSFLSPRLKIANFSVLGDVEFTEKAGEELEKILRKRKLFPDCFVGPEVKVVPFVHHMAKRFGHNRYVILRKSVKGYMVDPLIEYPKSKAPQHIKKLVLDGRDRDFLKGKKVVLVDDVVSTGVTMRMLEGLMGKIGVIVLAKCCLFKQNGNYGDELISLAELPLLTLDKSSA